MILLAAKVWTNFIKRKWKVDAKMGCSRNRPSSVAFTSLRNIFTHTICYNVPTRVPSQSTWSYKKMTYHLRTFQINLDSFQRLHHLQYCDIGPNWYFCTTGDHKLELIFVFPVLEDWLGLALDANRQRHFWEITTPVMLGINTILWLGTLNKICRNVIYRQ